MSSIKKIPTLYIIIPCYNEEEIFESKLLQNELFPYFNNNLIKKNHIAQNSKIVFVNDGSKDKSWEWIEKLNNEFSFVCGIKLSSNKGHQNALMAGLDYAKEQKADISISIDADLQDDINVIYDMIKEYSDNKCEIVYGVRSKRETDTFFKRFTAESYYKLLSLLGVKIVFNSADYRLLSYDALCALSQYNEKNLFLRGIVPQLGFKTGTVYYGRKARTAGESKYPLKKMLALAFEGITSFSIQPIRWILFSGIAISFISAIILLYSLFQRLFGYTEVGWTSLMGSIWFLGGLQIFFIGIIGEYLGKVYMETKNRPRYIIEKIIK